MLSFHSNGNLKTPQNASYIHSGGLTENSIHRHIGSDIRWCGLVGVGVVLEEVSLGVGFEISKSLIGPLPLPL